MKSLRNIRSVHSKFYLKQQNRIFSVKPKYMKARERNSKFKVDEIHLKSSENMKNFVNMILRDFGELIILVFF